MLVKSKMSAPELGALWTTYHKKTMILRILEHFISKSEDQKAKDLMSGLWEKLHSKVIEITTMLENDGAVPPIGFSRKMLLWMRQNYMRTALILCSVGY